MVNNKIKGRKNIQFHIDDLFDESTQANWEPIIKSAAFIVLDVDPHNGNMEIRFYEWLKRIKYTGFVVCDDIWYFKDMRDNFWNEIPYNERYDLTELGHWSGTGVFTFNSDITFPKTNTTDWTLVTAYYDLTKCSDASNEICARDKVHYLHNARATMALPYNLIVYCEEENIDILKTLRPFHLQERTQFIIKEFDSFSFIDTFAQYREKIAVNRINHPYYFDNRNTPSYYLFCMSRYIMLRETVATNPFNSTHFGWINMCIERMGYKNVQYLDDALSVHRDKFSTCYIDYIPENLVKNTQEYFKMGRCGMCSGFFTGNNYYMNAVCDLIKNKFLEYLEKGFGHADEQLYTPVYFENPTLFEHYYGDYQQMITNYVTIRERAEPPIYNFVRNSFKHNDLSRCRQACEFIIRSIQSGHCNCDSELFAEVEKKLALCYL